MILASNNFFTSLSIMGNNMGFIFLSFFLKGLASYFKGILCSMMFVSYVLKSSYFREKTSANSLKILAYSTLCSFDRLLYNLTYLGSYSFPKLHSVTSTSLVKLLTFTTTSFLLNNLSKGTSPFGVWFLSK
jgi:hypothetical protein